MADEQGRDGDRTIPIRPGLSIPMAEISFSFHRSGGPGGQHVNKVETGVTLSFDVDA